MQQALLRDGRTTMAVFAGVLEYQVWGRNPSDKDAHKCQHVVVHSLGDWWGKPALTVRNFYPETGKFGFIYLIYLENFRGRFKFLYDLRPSLVVDETVLKRLRGKHKGERSIVRVVGKKYAVIQPWDFRKNRGKGASIKGRSRMRISTRISFWSEYEIISRPKKEIEKI